MKTRIIILAGGSGSRWGNFRDTQKHLVTVEGERLLDRTTRQFLKHCSDVWVVGKNKDYQIDQTKLIVPKEQDESIELDKFISSHDLWVEGSSNRTILVFGDVYFTDEAVKTIVSDTKDWRFFLRTKASEITGKNCKEIFAIAFDSSFNVVLSQAIFKLYLHKNNIQTAAGWHLFRQLNFDNPFYRGNLFNNDRYIEIDDWTEDFDYPKDLTTWESRRSQI
jgi:hypothetical protein